MARIDHAMDLAADTADEVMTLMGRVQSLLGRVEGALVDYARRQSPGDPAPGGAGVAEILALYGSTLGIGQQVLERCAQAHATLAPALAAWIDGRAGLELTPGALRLEASMRLLSRAESTCRDMVQRIHQDMATLRLVASDRAQCLAAEHAARALILRARRRSRSND